MMKSAILKLVLLTCFILQSSCEITFKKKKPKDEYTQTDMGVMDKFSDKAKLKKQKAAKRNSDIIAAYYADIANEIIRKDMISHTKISEKQTKRLVPGKTIPREIQVMPLPMELEKMLTPLELNFIRVQVGNRIIIMNLKSREILDVVRI